MQASTIRNLYDATSGICDLQHIGLL